MNLSYSPSIAFSFSFTLFHLPTMTVFHFHTLSFTYPLFYLPTLSLFSTLTPFSIVLFSFGHARMGLWQTLSSSDLGLNASNHRYHLLYFSSRNSLFLNATFCESFCLTYLQHLRVPLFLGSSYPSRRLRLFRRLLSLFVTSLYIVNDNGNNLS